eukprot:TRINITY_DN73183_c0_g1_i1.p1 TRINITY_DN73183_c0_g1~~TRINITY_DN73183_c0_g1_i1.p1  ORF type:complete len:374 (-),score=51.04 TRINITY_DN73183_c0_g1_i1:48-1139(-)
MVRTITHVRRHDASTLTWSKAKAIYKRDQVLLIGGAGEHETAEDWYAWLCGYYRASRATVKKQFTLETGGRQQGAPLTAPRLFAGGTQRPGGSWYASFIVQEDEDRFEAALEALPWPTPPLWRARHSDALWFFVGQNGGRTPMRGRPEHTDQVAHSGTWHFQLSGTKTWLIRPHASERGWSDGAPPRLRCRRTSAKTGQSRRAKSKAVAAAEEEGCEQGADGRLRLRLRCRPGDLLLINTRLWWHQTEIDSTRDAASRLSLSCARDFYLGKKDTSCDMTNVDGLYATKAVKRGSVVLWESEMPSCSLPRSAKPNCCVSFDLDEGALVALHDLKAGDWLTVAPSDDEDEGQSDSQPKSKRQRKN